MKLRSTTIIVAIGMLILTGCNHKPPGPDDDHEINARVTIRVTDTGNHGIENAEVLIGGPGGNLFFVDFTGPFGTTHQYNFSGDTTTGIEVYSRVPGYVPSIDTFYLELIQPQAIQVKLANEIRILKGRFSFIIRDTTGKPIPGAELYATWYPGPSWNSTWSIITESDTLGQISNRTFIVDSSRNFISVGFSKNGYQTLVDTLFIKKDTLQEISIILKTK